MRIILLKEIKGLGKKNEIKEVREGYARNYLLPRGDAIPATQAAIKKTEEEIKINEERLTRLKAELEEKAREIKKEKLVFKLKTNKQGEVFGSVNKNQIEKALAEKGFLNLKADLEKPIKALGNFKIKLDLGQGIKATIEVEIEKE